MEPLFARDLRASGRSTRPLEEAARAGSLERIRPGVFAPAAWGSASERDRHLVKMRAAHRVLRTRLVFSHESAAAVHGIPVMDGWPDSVRVSYDGSGGRASRIGIRWSRATWLEGDVQRSAGLLVTSPRRTAIDLARCGSPAQGVAALDWILRHGDDRGEVTQRLRLHRPSRGAARLDYALGIARGLSESPLESLSLVRIAQLGFAPPIQQFEVVADGATYRLDFFWERGGIAGEADGRGKYDEPAVLWREKQREDAIRRQVGGFVRWTWADAWRGEPLARLLSAAGVPRA